jgi:Family of unknown function (DUF6541)
VSSIAAVAACLLFCAVGWLLLRLIGGHLRLRDQALMSPAAGMAAVVLLSVIEGELQRRTTGVDVAALGVLLLAVAAGSGSFRGLQISRDKAARAVLHLLPGLLLVALFAAAAGGMVYPPSNDTITNAGLAQWFLQGHLPPPVIVNHVTATASPEIRYGVGMLASVISEFSGLDAGLSTTAVVWLTLFAMPGALMVFCSRLGCTDRTVAVIGFVSLGFGLTPFRALVLGQQPQSLGAYVLAPVAAVAVWDALELRGLRAGALAVLLVAGLYYVHFSDGPTAVLLFATLGVARLGGVRFDRGTLLYGGAVAAAILAAAWPGMHYRAPNVAGAALGSGNSVNADLMRLLVHNSLGSFFGSVLGATVTPPAGFLLAPVAGMGALLGRRRRATVAMLSLFAVLVVLQLDAWMWQWPRHVFDQLVPWSDPERLAYLDWFALVGLAGIALSSLFGAVRFSERGRLLLGSVAVAAVVTPGLVYWPQLVAFAQTNYVGLTVADVKAIPELHTVVPTSDLILTDGLTDGGAWIPLLSDNQTLLNETWSDSTAAPAIETALRDLCRPDAGAQLNALHVKWLYLGPKVSDIDHYADRSCLTGTAALQPVALPGVNPQSGPWLFSVVAAG